MKKESLIIVVAALFFACGSNAGNNGVTIETEEKTEKVESAVELEVFQENENLVDVSTNELTEQKSEEIIETVVVTTDDTEDKLEEVLVVEKEIIVDEPVEVVEEVNHLDVEKLMVDHSSWDSLLKKNVSSAGKVNYKGMKVSISILEKYLNLLKENPPKEEWSKNEKLAYWINLYNASTVHLIASNYPASSITKLSGGKPWDKKFVKSGDKVYTLNQIENDIVRPRFKDPRIHAALNCAAVSCPSLLNEAFVASMLNNQLNKQCMVWVKDVTKNKLEENKLKVSQIFDWYKDDFKAGGGVVTFINKYATTKVSPKAKVSYLEYNWALNE